MAITGKLGADFAEFFTAVQQAEAHLKSFESDAGKVEARLSAVSDSFSGRRIVSEATLAVKAVEEVGGATALTAKEQEKVNRLIGEAIAKYTALGQEAPDDMQALYAATKKVEEPTEGLSTGMIAVGTTIGNMAADAIMSLGRLAVDGIGAVVTAIGDLIVEGADVGDISGNFEHLAESAGHVSSTLLGEMRAGMHGTVNDMELMKTANSAMAAGLNLTDQQFGQLTKGAFALSNATGMDATQALNTMTDAMVSGKAGAIGLLTGKLDLESAERRYALSIGKTRDELTDAQRLEADRSAILDAVAGATARLGEQQDGLMDKVAQSQAEWDNFRASLAQTIADSPVLAAGFDALKSSLVAAFGGDQQKLIEQIAGLINQGAIVAADFGLVVVEMARGAAQAYGALMVPINAVAAGILTLVERTAAGLASMLELAASVPGIGEAFEGTATAARAAQSAWAGMREKAVEDVETAQRLASGQGAVHDALNKVQGVLVNVKGAMVAANTATTAAGAAVDAHAASATAQAGALNQATTATGQNAEALKQQEDALKRARAEQEKMNKAMTELNSVGGDWLETLESMDQGVVDMADAYLRAGASQAAVQTALNLTDGQIKAITTSIKVYDKAIADSTKLQQEWARGQEAAATTAAGLWAEHAKIRDAQTKTSTDQQIAEIERWKQALITKHEAAGTLTEDLYNAIEATAAAKLDAIRVDWSTLNTSSQAYLQEIADKARATYEEAATGSRGLTNEQVENFRRIAEEAQRAADNYGTAFTGAAADVSGAMNKAAQDAIDAAKRLKDGTRAQLGTVGNTFGLGMKGGSFTMPSTSLAGVPQGQWGERLQQAGEGAQVRYDDFGNPYIWKPGSGIAEGVADPGWSRLRFKGAGSGPLDALPPFIGAMMSWMAEGGPVRGGQPYVVGERGPELFIPATGGQIIPNRAGAGGAGASPVTVTLNVNGAVLGTADELARLVGDALVGRLLRQGVRLPAGV